MRSRASFMHAVTQPSQYLEGSLHLAAGFGVVVQSPRRGLEPGLPVAVFCVLPAAGPAVMQPEYVVDDPGRDIEGANLGEQQRVKFTEHLFGLMVVHRGRQAEDGIAELEPRAILVRQVWFSDSSVGSPSVSHLARPAWFQRSKAGRATKAALRRIEAGSHRIAAPPTMTGWLCQRRYNPVTASASSADTTLARFLPPGLPRSASSHRRPVITRSACSSLPSRWNKTPARASASSSWCLAA